MGWGGIGARGVENEDLKSSLESLRRDLRTADERVLTGATLEMAGLNSVSLKERDAALAELRFSLAEGEGSRRALEEMLDLYEGERRSLRELTRLGMRRIRWLLRIRRDE